VFKDRDTLEPRHKALVTPDAIVSKNWDVDPSTWLGKDGPYTFYVNSDAAGTGGGASKNQKEPNRMACIAKLSLFGRMGKRPNWN